MKVGGEISKVFCEMGQSFPSLLLLFLMPGLPGSSGLRGKWGRASDLHQHLRATIYRILFLLLGISF